MNKNMELDLNNLPGSYDLLKSYVGFKSINEGIDVREVRGSISSMRTDDNGIVKILKVFKSKDSPTPPVLDEITLSTNHLQPQDLVPYISKEIDIIYNNKDGTLFDGRLLGIKHDDKELIDTI